VRRNVADWVMYRKALASAARGWPVHWYNAKSVLGAASQALRVENLDAYFLKVRRAIGPPWKQGSQARNCGGHSHGERGCGVSRET
jgi:hypothetical protein